MILMYYIDGIVPLSVCVREMNVRSHKYISIILLIYLFDTITILSFYINIYSYQYSTINKYSVFDTHLLSFAFAFLCLLFRGNIFAEINNFQANKQQKKKASRRAKKHKHSHRRDREREERSHTSMEHTNGIEQQEHI